MTDRPRQFSEVPLGVENIDGLTDRLKTVFSSNHPELSEGSSKDRSSNSLWRYCLRGLSVLGIVALGAGLSVSSEYMFGRRTSVHQPRTEVWIGGTTHPVAARSAATPAIAKPPMIVSRSARHAPKVFLAALHRIKPRRRLGIGASARRRTMQTQQSAAGQFEFAKPLHGEALRRAVLEDAAETRKANLAEIRAIQAKHQADQ